MFDVSGKLRKSGDKEADVKPKVALTKEELTQIKKKQDKMNQEK